MIRALAIGLLAATAVSSAMAADLIVEEPVVVPDEVVLSGFYAQLLAGVALPGTQVFEGSGSGEWDLEWGPAAAVAVGVNVFDGLSVELDALYTNRAFDPADADGASSTLSVMGNLKYTFALADTFDVYVAAGSGYIWETHLEDYDFGGWGYQLIVGAAFDVTENVALVGEYRFQDSFSPLENTDTPVWTHEVPKQVLLVGAKLSF